MENGNTGQQHEAATDKRFRDAEAWPTSSERTEAIDAAAYKLYANDTWIAEMLGPDGIEHRAGQTWREALEQWQQAIGRCVRDSSALALGQILLNQIERNAAEAAAREVDDKFYGG